MDISMEGGTRQLRIVRRDEVDQDRFIHAAGGSSAFVRHIPSLGMYHISLPLAYDGKVFLRRAKKFETSSLSGKSIVTLETGADGNVIAMEHRYHNPDTGVLQFTHRVEYSYEKSSSWFPSRMEVLWYKAMEKRYYPSTTIKVKEIEWGAKEMTLPKIETKVVAGNLPVIVWKCTDAGDFMWKSNRWINLRFPEPRVPEWLQ